VLGKTHSANMNVLVRLFQRGAASPNRALENPAVTASCVLSLAVLLVAILWRVWPALTIPWWFSTDEVVLFYEVIRQLRLDPSQTFFDIPGTPYITLTTILTFLWWAAERAIGFAANLSPSDFAFAHIQGVFTLMRAITLALYVVAIAIAFDLFRRAAGAVTAFVAVFLFASLPIHVTYSYFARTESLGLVLSLSAVWILLYSNARGSPKAYCWAGVLCGVAMAARYHFALAAFPVIAAIYFLRDRRNVGISTTARPRGIILWIAGVLGAIFVTGSILALGYRAGWVKAGALTNVLLLSTAGGPTEFPDAKRLIYRLWIFLGIATLATLALYAARPTRSLMRFVINPFTLAFIVSFAIGFVCTHPEFLWRGTFQLQSIQFYSDWTDPNLLSLGMLGKWWHVTEFYLESAFPERSLKIALLIGGCVAIWRREAVSLAFLAGAVACFIAHPLNMKLWPHHIIPWLPFLCFVASIPIAWLMNLIMTRARRPAAGVAIVIMSAMLLSFTYRHRLQGVNSYLLISRDRTDRISAMSNWLSTNVPADGYLLMSYFALNDDGFLEWIKSVGVSVPGFVEAHRNSHIWWLDRSAVDGHAGFLCASPADITFFRADFERRAAGSTYNPFDDQRFQSVARFGDGFYGLQIFKFDFRAP
jgi:hypothetical protein